MADLLRMAEMYVNAEEGMTARKQKTSWLGHQVEKGEHSRNAPAKEEKRKDRSELQRYELRYKLSKREESPRRGAPISAYNSFAPLLETCTRILAMEKDKVPIQWPVPLRSSAEKRDVDQFFQYHRDYDHDTEECRHLKNHIEDLIRRGHLMKYVDRDAPQERREHRDEALQ
ncbi:hypothetical protein CFOL_v3_19386 [Cephalotus follicularis]|uniref:Uncharacterized protein n=1 Tax=Cephalotus follicularis TaxID=3775 RepID=A0A1Q3C6R8_CEPFO|nr:hypothetical protein CFOL_v3_19386 [Cephalotus follicularis]